MLDKPFMKYIRYARKGVNTKGDIKNSSINGVSSLYMSRMCGESWGYVKVNNAIVIAQYSFPMNTESVIHGFRRHKVLSDTCANCPLMAGLCPELDVVLNSQMVDMVYAQKGK